MASRAAEWALPELKARGLARLDWRTLFEERGTLPDAEREAIAAYFAHFLPPGPCVGCGAQQGAESVLDGFIGKAKFTWGLAHGEGFCRDCGYPARAYHRNVGPIEFLSVILQYHPDELRAREPDLATFADPGEGG